MTPQDEERARWKELLTIVEERQRDLYEAERIHRPVIDAFDPAGGQVPPPEYTAAWNAIEAAHEAFAKSRAEADAAVPKRVREEEQRLLFDGTLEIARRAGRVPKDGGNGRVQ